MKKRTCVNCGFEFEGLVCPVCDWKEYPQQDKEKIKEIKQKLEEVSKMRNENKSQELEISNIKSYEDAIKRLKELRFLKKEVNDKESKKELREKIKQLRAIAKELKDKEKEQIKIALIGTSEYTIAESRDFRDKVLMAKERATLAREIIEQQGLYCWIPPREKDPKNAKKYVTCQGWKLLVSLFGLIPEISNVQKEYNVIEYTDEKGKVRKFRVVTITSEAVLKDKNGNTWGRAYGTCSNQENNWRNKDETAILGMSQTRAIARACKVFDWAMQLAGYEPVPAEEITDNSAPISMTQEEREEIEIE